MPENPPSSIIHDVNWESFALIQASIDAMLDPIFVKDLQHRWIACNQAFCKLMGYPREALIGRSDPAFFPPAQVEVFWHGDDEVFASGQPRANEEVQTQADGLLHTIWTRKFPLRDQQGQVVALSGVITNITEIKRRQEQVERLEEELQLKEAELARKETEIQDKLAIIHAQDSLLDQIAVPVIQVWESILLLPLIGLIDSHRAVRVLESLLESITHYAAQVVILDITGVPVVDTSVAGYLVRAVQAAQLLGCQSILVGISPEIAQTLVGLDIDFSKITTRASLQSGLEYALKRLQYTVAHNETVGPKARR